MFYDFRTHESIYKSIDMYMISKRLSGTQLT